MAKNRRVDTGIVQRGKSYMFTVSLGLDTNKKQIRKTTTYRPPTGVTQRKADSLAKEEYFHFKERCKGFIGCNDNMRFSALCELYLRIYASQLKLRTYDEYKFCIDRIFLPEMGNKKIKDISPLYLSMFFSTICEKRHIRISTMKTYATALKSIFTFARKTGIIRESPCQNMILPKNKDFDEKVKNRPLSIEEVPDFIKCFNEDTVWDRLVLFLLNTGMRGGEAIALEWHDIDWDNHRLMVSKTLSRCSKGLYVSTPKTASSRRFVSLNHLALDTLQKQKEYYERVLSENPNFFKHPDIIFFSAKGDYLFLANLTRTIHERTKGTQFEDITTHSLRHTHATLLLNSGVDLALVSKNLGHASVSTTANIYVDILRSTQEKVAQKMEELLLSS